MLACVCFHLVITQAARRARSFLTNCLDDESAAPEESRGARLRVLGNGNAVPADLTSMMMRRLIWLIGLSFSFAFIVTAAAGPVVSVVACAGMLVYALAMTRGAAACRAEAAGAEAAEAEAAEAETEARAAVAEAVIAEAEAVVAAARLRLLGGAAS